MRKNFAGALWALGIATAALASSACGVDHHSSLTLSEFRGLKVDSDGCSYTDGPVSGIVFDAQQSARSGSPWITYMVLENHLADNADPEVGRLNSHRMQLSEVVLTIKPAEGWTFQPVKKRIQTSGITIDTGGTLYQGIPAIDAALASMLLEHGPIKDFGRMAPLTLTFQAKGKLLDGSSIESNELNYVLTVCNNCNLGCPMGEEIAAVCSPVQSDGFTCEEAEEEPIEG